ncbi:mycothiol-dependent nitroreductase Rv2466c family protein [Streptomyces capillispiralis]|uniref:DSBA-like thioredoxin domain-containing protein n=1 Tax=Streptomyces capillispiralis TaxID=68182 RepID=A0A561TC92_9ACTN|nr:disulfide bond formation protein DsbA [Streptomyces capillispiralis]TWF84734.1 hypothetical protein FHX78_111670 [Streptomyces capillispiralis]GHH95798.1 DSBA oxidoreductase [Streptomyces capillispiralis]
MASTADADRTRVDFWFDPLCPWTWMTSRWLTEVAALRPLDIRWHVMSLAILNEGRLDQVPQEYHDLLGPKGLRPVRTLVAVRQSHGNEAVARLYTALGAVFHRDGKGPTPEALTEALKSAELPTELAEHADATTYDAEVRASHEAGQKAVGEEAGSPILAVPGPDATPVGFFGPIVSPVPRSDAALSLWDTVVHAASVPGFAELKRARTAPPSFD